MVQVKAEEAGHVQEKAEEAGHGACESRRARTWCMRKQKRQGQVMVQMKAE